MTLPQVPSWARELVTLLPACAHFLLSGNVRDQYFAPSTARTDGGPQRVLRTLPRLLAEAVRGEGIDVVVSYDIALGATTIPDDEAACVRAREALGGDVARLAPRGSLSGLLELIGRVSDSATPTALVIRSASRLVRDVGQLSDEEFDFWRAVDQLARSSSPRPGVERPLHSPVIWILDSERDVPSWFALRNEALRSIVLPLPHTGERRAMAERLLPLLGAGDPAASGAAAAVLTEQMAGMTLVAMQRTVAIASDQGIGPDRVEDAARSYRVGVTDNPWRASYLVERLRQEVEALRGAPGAGTATSSESPAASVLASRVLGQDVAVRKALDILVRSATGLTAAQASPSATRPRGVLFFAGPTGVGKTELAKALTKLLFDDERFYVRFDMSEFSAEHASDRLIGAPPGYVGYDAGGELTNAIRQRPFSLVLFDEIEKAHPRILDKFLQLLDDGRLTDGRGETVFFTESVVVFTSNLGIYTDIEETDASGATVRRRRPTVDRATATYEELSATIQLSIRDFFTLHLGRPELLNRIGDNIVVFDFIDRTTGARILDGMLANIARRVQQEHGVTVVVPEDIRQELRDVCLDDDTLALGGRGIGSKLETVVINPLANQLFLQPPARDARLELRVMREEDVGWTARLAQV